MPLFASSAYLILYVGSSLNKILGIFFTNSRKILLCLTRKSNLILLSSILGIPSGIVPSVGFVIAINACFFSFFTIFKVCLTANTLSKSRSTDVISLPEDLQKIKAKPRIIRCFICSFFLPNFFIYSSDGSV